MRRACSRRLAIRRSHAVDVALGGPEHRMTFVWHRDDPELHELRVTLAQVALAAFGFGELPRVRMPFLEGERLVLLKASSSLPGTVMGPTGNCIGLFVAEAPPARFDASLTAFAFERDGEPCIDLRLVNVRIAADGSPDQKMPS